MQINAPKLLQELRDVHVKVMENVTPFTRDPEALLDICVEVSEVLTGHSLNNAEVYAVLSGLMLTQVELAIKEFHNETVN